MPAVNSSNIAHIAHDPDTGRLAVRFHHGGTYAYAGVPSDLVNTILAAPSIGKAFNALVKAHPDQYPYLRVA